MDGNGLFDYSSLSAGIPLSQFTSAISRAVNSSPDLFGAWVIAELSDVRVAGGHCYLELIEKNTSGQTVAKLRATIWQSTFSNLRRKFFQATRQEITTGLKVLVKGNATHHSLYGLAFNITDIDPSYTMGDLERLRKEILLRLSNEGILNLNKQRVLPLAPQKIAVISAEGAAGYGDFINHLTSNQEGFVFYPCLFPCSMQGERVSSSIREAIQFIEIMIDFWDCIVIVRGGGATTDLNGFDDYELAKAVAQCGLPVIVGIGHERDRNVLDDVAHTSVKTPTAVAGFFIDRLREAYDKVLVMADRLRQAATDKMRGEERHLASVESIIPQLALRRLSDNKARLRSLADRIPIMVSGRIGREKAKLIGKSEMIGSLAKAVITKNYQKIDSIENLLKVLDPSNTLKRGYSITRVNGKAVKDESSLNKDAIITTRLYRGEIKSKVL